MTDILRVATRHLGRPLLLTPQAAGDLVGRIRAMDPNFAPRESRVAALMRKLSGAERARVKAMEDDEPAPQIPFGELGAYQPLYIGEPDDLGFCWSLKDGIALINCDTPLLARGERWCGSVWHGYDTLLAAMRESSADERVKAIFFRADSPGGVVDEGLIVLADWMRRNRAAAGGKPIHIYADQACSAMYWIAAQSDEIDAGGVSIVGSIGAVIVHEDYSAALEKAGVKITALQFGAKKTDGAWWETLSPRAAQDLQAEIDQCGRNFVADVAAGRKQLTEEKQLALEAGCFMGRHDDPERSALALGLVDKIMGEEAAFAALAASVAGAAPVSPATLAKAAAANPQQEQPMAETADDKAARVAALRNDLKAARAAKDATKTAAIRAQLKAEGADDSEEEDPEETPAPAKKPEEENEPEATKIATSPEAKSHPALALAAIGSGQTLAQFKASVEASGQSRGSALRDRMAGSPRLGNDAPAAASDPGARLMARAEATARRMRGDK